MGAVLAEVFVFYVAEIFLINVDVAYLPFILFVTAVATLCMGWLLLLFLLSFSVRVKLGNGGDIPCVTSFSVKSDSSPG